MITGYIIGAVAVVCLVSAFILTVALLFLRQDFKEEEEEKEKENVERF